MQHLFFSKYIRTNLYTLYQFNRHSTLYFSLVWRRTYFFSYSSNHNLLDGLTYHVNLRTSSFTFSKSQVAGQTSFGGRDHVIYYNSLRLLYICCICVFVFSQCSFCVGLMNSRMYCIFDVAKNCENIYKVSVHYLNNRKHIKSLTST